MMMIAIFPKSSALARRFQPPCRAALLSLDPVAPALARLSCRACAGALERDGRAFLARAHHQSPSA
eukprot:7375674-Pyramimonas_sp.AAC.1